MQNLFYSRHKCLKFQKYVVCYSFERAFGTYRDEGTINQFFARYKGKTRSLKRPCYYYVSTKYLDIPEALFENVRFMKQIVSLFFMKAFYLEVLQKNSYA